MNKIVSLLFVSFAIATTPFQSAYSCLSKKEAEQARRVAQHHEDFWATHFDQCRHTIPTWSAHTPKSQALICLFMVYLLLSQSHVDALPDKSTQGKGHQVPRHYISESDAMWLKRLHEEAWGETFHPDEQHHTIEEFIGGLVRCSREGGEKAVIDFLEKAEGWGFALESFFYTERNGRAYFVLGYLLARNDPSVDNGSSVAEKLQQSISNIHSIVSNHDVSNLISSAAGSCFSGSIRRCFGFAPSVSMTLEIPLAYSKNVHINIVRQRHNVPLDAEPSKKTQQEHREDL